MRFILVIVCFLLQEIPAEGVLTKEMVIGKYVKSYTEGWKNVKQADGTNAEIIPGPKREVHMELKKNYEMEVNYSHELVIAKGKEIADKGTWELIGDTIITKLIIQREDYLGNSITDELVERFLFDEYCNLISLNNKQGFYRVEPLCE